MIAGEEHPTPTSHRPDQNQKHAHWFTTTHWSVVLTAKKGDSLQAGEAMEALCRSYWPPLYAFIQRDGYSRADAQDLTQKFFQHLMARDFLAHLKNQEGKFRSDRKSTRLNSSHLGISYAVFCLKKKINFITTLDVKDLTSGESHADLDEMGI